MSDETTVVVERDIWAGTPGMPPALVLEAEEYAEDALLRFLASYDDLLERQRDDDGDIPDAVPWIRLTTEIQVGWQYVQATSAALQLADRLCRGWEGQPEPELRAWREAKREWDDSIRNGLPPDIETETLFNREDDLAKWYDARWPA